MYNVPSPSPRQQLMYAGSDHSELLPMPCRILSIPYMCGVFAVNYRKKEMFAPQGSCPFVPTYSSTYQISCEEIVLWVCVERFVPTKRNKHILLFGI